MPENEKAQEPDSAWCDDCKGFTHTEWCPAFSKLPDTQSEENAVQPVRSLSEAPDDPAAIGGIADRILDFLDLPSLLRSLDEAREEIEKQRQLMARSIPDQFVSEVRARERERDEARERVKELEARFEALRAKLIAYPDYPYRIRQLQEDRDRLTRELEAANARREANDGELIRLERENASQAQRIAELERQLRETIDLHVADVNRLRARVGELEGERDRWKAHSEKYEGLALDSDNKRVASQTAYDDLALEYDRMELERDALQSQVRVLRVALRRISVEAYGTDGLREIAKRALAPSEDGREEGEE